jgi:transcriptional regulator with XRE-family HTH domain
LVFYKQLKTIAQQFNLSLNHIERDLGYPRNTLSYYRRGGQPKVQRLLELADYFDVPFTFFLDETDEQLKMTIPEKTGAMGEIQKIKHEMKEQNISILELTHYSRLSRSEISEYLFTKKYIDKATLEEIWKALHEIEKVRLVSYKC